MTITVSEAEDIVFDNHIDIRNWSEHRWYTKQLVVFERDGNLLGFWYYDPASELQEDQERFEDDPVPVFPVTTKEVAYTIYEPA